MQQYQQNKSTTIKKKNFFFSTYTHRRKPFTQVISANSLVYKSIYIHIQLWKKKSHNGAHPLACGLSSGRAKRLCKFLISFSFLSFFLLQLEKDEKKKNIFRCIHEKVRKTKCVYMRVSYTKDMNVLETNKHFFFFFC